MTRPPHAPGGTLASGNPFILVAGRLDAEKARRPHAADSLVERDADDAQASENPFLRAGERIASRPRTPLLDLLVALLILPPVLCALGWLALGMVDLPPIPWSTVR